MSKLCLTTGKHVKDELSYSARRETENGTHPPRNTTLTPVQLLIGIQSFARSRLHNLRLSQSYKSAFEEWSTVCARLVVELQGRPDPTQQRQFKMTLLLLLDNMYRQEDSAWAHVAQYLLFHSPRPQAAGIDYLLVRATLHTLTCVLILCSPSHCLLLQAKGLPANILVQSGVKRRSCHLFMSSSSDQKYLLHQISVPCSSPAAVHQWSQVFLRVQDSAVKAYNLRNPQDQVLSLQNSVNRRAACEPHARTSQE